MSVLFGKRRRNEDKVLKNESDPSAIISVTSNGSEIETKQQEQKQKIQFDSDKPSVLVSFLNLGLDPWIVKKCELVGIRHPTPVQMNCIPPILEGKDVLGCAQTGSGKTAAFALPILHTLGKDIYGPYALVLTPTRELAYQIADQFNIFGSSIGVRCAVIVGGVDMLKQALELQNRPHIIIATPGRLHDHLLRPNPPNLGLIKFLVLDEADRLLDVSFAKDLAFILEKSPSKRQTLLFSATMTANLDHLEKMSLTNAYRFDATPSATTVDTLKQFYLFIPAQVKMTYMMYLMTLLDPNEEDQEKEKEKIDFFKKKKTKPLKRMNNNKDHNYEDILSIGVNKTTHLQSMIIFVATCKMCELIGEIANEMETKCVTLHSMMSQQRRLAALGKFKSGRSRILISTDVASRGLDIPEVDIVINFDLPRDADDYIHRVGRTARAGRRGESICLVTQHDIVLLQNIEDKIKKKLQDYEPQAKEKNVLRLLNDVTIATRIAKMKLKERGFDEKVFLRKEKKKNKKEE